MNEFGESAVAIASVLGFFAVIIVLIVQVGVTWRARTMASRDQAYRTLAEQAAQLQAKTELELSVLTEKVSSMERLMREVG